MPKETNPKPQPNKSISKPDAHSKEKVAEQKKPKAEPKHEARPNFPLGIREQF